MNWGSGIGSYQETHQGISFHTRMSTLRSFKLISSSSTQRRLECFQTLLMLRRFLMIILVQIIFYLILFTTRKKLYFFRKERRRELLLKMDLTCWFTRLRRVGRYGISRQSAVS